MSGAHEAGNVPSMILYDLLVYFNDKYERRNERGLTSIACSVIRNRHIVCITEVKLMKGRERVREKIECKIVFSLSHPLISFA